MRDDNLRYSSLAVRASLSVSRSSHRIRAISPSVSVTGRSSMAALDLSKAFHRTGWYMRETQSRRHDVPVRDPSFVIGPSKTRLRRMAHARLYLRVVHPKTEHITYETGAHRV